MQYTIAHVKCSNLCKQSPPTPVSQEQVFADVALNYSNTNPGMKKRVIYFRQRIDFKVAATSFLSFDKSSLDLKKVKKNQPELSQFF